MKTVTFWEGVLFALLASIIGSIGIFGLSSLLPTDCLIRLLISGLTIAYVVYLLCRSQERAGRVVTVAILLITSAMLWLAYPPISIFLGVHLLAVWLIRSLYFYASLLSSLIDIGLIFFSISAAFWACRQTDSVFLSVWCFFLVQALFVVIPAEKKPPKHKNTNATSQQPDFNRAYQTAESAVRKLSSIN